MTTPAEAIEAQRIAINFSELGCRYSLITPEELAGLYAIKDAFEKVMEMLAEDENGTGKRNAEVNG